MPKRMRQIEENDSPNRRYLTVIPATPEELRLYRGAGQLVLSPPPVAMPWGLGTTNGLTEGIVLDGKPVIDGWVLDEQEGKPVKMLEACRPLRQSAVYMEYPFTSYGIIDGVVCVIFLSVGMALVGYIFNVFLPAVITAILFSVSICALVLLGLRQNSPTFIFNRLRREIYTYSRYSSVLLVKKFDETKFSFFVTTTPSAGFEFEALLEPGNPFHDTVVSIQSSRGLPGLIPTWEYLRRYMEPGDGYKELPVRKDTLLFIPGTQFWGRFETNLFSKPNRWPPEIEMLLWPESKDAPLPEGWEYDTWIPYDIPWGGFDNTELLREREQRLSKCQEAPASL